jgi:hypothetical protein
MSTSYGNSQGGNFLPAGTPGRGSAATRPVGYNRMDRARPVGDALPGQLERAAARYASKFRQGVSRLIGVGDSWTAGQGASSPDKNYYNQLKASAAALMPTSSFASSGKTVTEYRQNALADGVGAATLALHQPQIDDLVFGIWALNDLRGGSAECGNNPVNWPQFQKRLQAVATWLMVPETARTRMHTLTNSAANPACTFIGTWVHTGFAGNLNFSYTQTVNNSVSFTTPVGNLLVLRFGIDAASTGLWKVEVDGVEVAQVSSKATYNNWALSSHIIRLATNQAHTVKLTLLSGDVMMLDSVDCVDMGSDFSATLVYSAPGYLLDAAGSGWSAAGGTANGATANGVSGASVYLYNNGGCDRFAFTMDEAMTQLWELGFNVVNCRARNGFNPDWHTSSGDRLHPNDQGHNHLFHGFYSAISYILPI